MKEGYFLKDTALIDKNNDAFHHEDYVKNLKMIIEEHEPPYNIALIGKWGVGKSSIINLLKKELMGKTEIVTHEINAWKYENDSLKKAFLKNLWQKFNPEKDVSFWKSFNNSFRETSMFGKTYDKPSTFKETIKEIIPLLLVLFSLFLVSSAGFLGLFYLWDVINAILTSNTLADNTKGTFEIFKKNIWVPIIIAPLFKMFQDFLKSSMQTKMADVKLVKPVETADEYEELFKEEIENYKKTHPEFKKLVVIVDDLDRLSTKKVVAALDAIKAFVDVNECIFIVTCDENILINALEKEKLNKSIDIDGELFLDKLFHFRISLPPIIENDMTEYALELTNQEAAGLVKDCNGQFEEIIDILIHAEVSTPRQVKKLINTFSNNLLIAKSREDNARKLEQELLTGKRGLKFLAKLSVIQSDYNDIYLNLSKDFTFLDDLLQVYLEDTDSSKVIKSTIKMLFDHKESTLKIKSHYEGLVNFLIRTQHISVENVAPYIYLAQDAIGLKAGDENQRAIRKNLLSGNEKGIITLLEKEKNKENIELAIIGEIKTSLKKDLPSVIKGAIQLINHVSVEKKELANSISYLLATTDMKQIRLWQVEPKNILETYNLTDNKNGIEKALFFVMDELFSRSDNWKNHLGRDMNNDDFNTQISILLKGLLDSNEKIPAAAKEKAKSFLIVETEDFDLYPFSSIHSLYKDYKELFWEYFGLSFFNHLIDDMENVEGDQLDEDIKTFLEISPLIICNYTTEFINAVPRILDILSKKSALDVLRLLPPIIDKITVKSGSEIVDSILRFKFKKDENVIEVLKLLQQIKFEVKEGESSAEKLNRFILNHLPEEYDETMKEISNLIEKVLEEMDVDFSLFDQTFKMIIENVLESPEYDVLIRKFNASLTGPQRTALFKKINTPISYSGYNESQFGRVYTLYSILKEEEENHIFIQHIMQQGINIFQNNQWSSYTNWANDFVKLFSITADLLEESNLDNYINSLINYVINSGHYGLAIKALMYIGENIPESKIVECINHTLSKAASETSKIDALEFLKLNDKHITNTNNALSLYADFLIDNIQLQVGNFLDVLYSKFSEISADNFTKLIKNLSTLDGEKSQLNINIIQRTVAKFFSTFESEDKFKVLDNLIKDIQEAEIIHHSLLNLLDENVVTYILNQVLNSDVEKDKIYRKSLLELCSKYHESLDKGSLTNLVVDTLRENDDTYIVEICEILLNEYATFRFGREKKHVSSQIIPAFRNGNNEAKEKILETSKAFYMDREFEQAIKDNLLTDEEKELVFNKLNFRKKRLFNNN